MRKATALVLTALLSAAPLAWAGQGAFSIQMFPFSVPVVGKDGRTVSASVATYLDVREEDDVDTVCQWEPRIRDAVNQVLFAHPMGLAGRQLDLGGADVLLHQAIAAAIESDLVVAVHVARETRPAQEVVGENTLLGCRRGKSSKAKVQNTVKGQKQKRKIGNVFKKYD